MITGYTKKVQQRSLLCSMEGYVTFQMETNIEVRTPTYFWNILKKNFSNDVVDSIKGMRMLATRKGVVFDLKEEHKAMFEDIGH